MDGSDIRRRREELQLSRPQLVGRLQAVLSTSDSRMTVGILAGIEVRRSEIRPSEVPLYQRALGLAADGSEVEEPEAEPSRNGHRVRKFPAGVDPTLVEFEWCGLKPGDIIKVEGCPRAYFEFRCYVADQEHPYVECYGGKRSHEKKRFFRPERIRTTRGRRVYVGADQQR